MSEIKKIAFIGSGNVSTHLAEAFANSGIELIGFYGRNQKTTQQMASHYHSKWGSVSELNPQEADLIIISVPDHAMEEVLQNLPKLGSLLAHTSGSLSMDILQKKGHRTAVFYPLQTFSKKKKVDFLNIPLMLEALGEDDLRQLENLAHKISTKVYTINSLQRKKIHIAAVFASNFSNYLYHIAEDLLRRNNIPFEVIQALIEETTDKIKKLSPYDAQTGPAVRKDLETMESHLKDLEEIPEYHEIYKLLSKHIIQSRK